MTTHPAVAECAVAGITAAQRRELVIAYVVPRDRQRVDPRDLIAFCALRLAQYKVPAMIETRRELPRDMLGRVSRRARRGLPGRGSADQRTAPGPAGMNQSDSRTSRIACLRVCGSSRSR